MKRLVIWLPEAEFTFNENINFLARKWNLEVINNFLDRVDEVIDNIAENPYVYPAYENDKNIRKCVVTKHISLYYKILENRIDLLTFWNNYQNPDDFEL